MPESENSEVAHVRQQLLQERTDIFFTVQHMLKGGHFLIRVEELRMR